MYVCLSVTGLRIVYIPIWHMPLIMPSQWRIRTGRIEDDGRLENESRDIAA